MEVIEPGRVENPSNDHPFRNWRIAGGMFASITLLLGAIGLAGWLFNEPLWRSIWKTGSEMKFNTALCLTLLGGAFLLSFSRRTFARKASAWAAMVVVLLTALTLLEYLLSLNFGIDELVYKDTNLLGTTFPGRMAGQSAISFIFLATGILLLRCESQRLRGAAQWVALVSLGFPTQALMGYALGRMTIVGLGPDSSYMAIPTATAFIAGALALLLREPDQFLMESLTARTQASAVFRRLLVSASLLPLMLGWLALNVVGGDQQSPQFSVATMALITTFIFVGLMWFNAARLNTVTQTLSKRDQLLRENEAMLRTVTNEAQVGLVLVNAERRYAFANQTYAEILRLPSADIVGQRVADVLADVYDQIRPRLDRAFAGERVHYELCLPAIPGKEQVRFYEVTYEPRIHALEPYVVVVLVEITPRKRAQANAALLASLAEDLVALRTVDEIMHAVSARIGEQLKLSICCFVEINEAADMSNVTHEWRRDANVATLLGTYRLSEYLSADFQKVLRAGNVFVVNDTETDPRTHAKNYAALQLRSFICVPLVRDGNWKFLFDVHHSAPHDWRADEIELVREITTRVWARLERIRSDSLLRQNEALFSALIEQSPTGVYVVDSQFKFQQVNARALPVFAKVTPLQGRDFAEVMHILWGPELGDQIVKIFRHTLATGEPYISERFTERRHDLGVEEAYEWETRRVSLPDGSHGVVCYFNDVTERERAATALRNSEALYRTIGESINYGVWVCDANGRNTYASESFLKLVGLTQEQCSNFGWGEVLHPEDIKATAAAWQECVRTGGNWDMEHRFKGVDGQWHHILARGMPVKDADGKILSWAGINLDITERKSAERALFESTERFRLLTEVIEMQVWTANPAGELDYANQECIKYLAVDLERDLLGNAWAQFVHPDDLPETIKRWQAALTTGEHYETEFRLRSKNGDYRWFLVRAKALRDDAGRISRWLGTNTDIHALKTAQQKATQASRAKDDFLAALSHELRTPLNPALLIASESADNHQLPEEVRGKFEVILKSIELEARLIDDLLDLTRITSGKLLLNKTQVDVHAALADALTTVRAEQQEKNIQLALKLAAETFWMEGDAVRLQQVFWNVLKNAVKFTPAGGRITVTTNRNASGQLAVSISDSGLGLSPDELGRVFSAFAQGDHAGGGGSHRFGGLGLGLAISKNLVELHAGGIRAESAGRDRGATFIIELPLTERKKESAPRAAAPANGSPADRSGIWILLVEDHEPTRAALVHLLVRRRYEVKSAASLAEARAFAAQHRFHLLISDIGLPDGNGFDLMTELRAGNPDLRGIALTGYGMEEDMARSRNAGFVSHLVKPVRVQAMEAALAAAIS